MGYNTPVMILNDASGNLTTDADVGRKLYDAIGMSQYPQYKESGVSFSIGNHANGGLVLPSRHADDIQIVSVGLNYMRRLAVVRTRSGGMSDSVELAKELADSLGYRLVKKS